jgi:protein-S-isoprenylcysteine O-methyltransferase Ste14
MRSAQMEGKKRSENGANWLTLAASLAVGGGFFALWFWLLPSWLDFHVDLAGRASWRWLAALPGTLGFAVASRCVWDFGQTGRGTPAPVAPPKKLVVVGFYRYARNPMYLGFFTGWGALWVIFGRTSRTALLVAALAVLAVALFVRWYEEPTLRKAFGAEYEEYCRNVPRWLPRWHPWQG